MGLFTHPDLRCAWSRESAILPVPSAVNPLGSELVGSHGSTFWLVSADAAQDALREGASPPHASLCAAVVSAAFEDVLRHSSRASLLNMLTHADSRLGELAGHPAWGRLQERGAFRRNACAVSAVVVRVHEDLVEYVLVQDAVLAIKDRVDNESTIFEDFRPKAFRELFLQAQARELLRGSGFEGEVFLRHVQAMREQERVHRNTLFGYPTLLGDGRGPQHALRAKFRPRTSDFDVILCSPGAARYWGIFQLPVRDLFQESLNTLAQTIRRREYEDDQGRWFPRVSRHADVGFLRIRVRATLA